MIKNLELQYWQKWVGKKFESKIGVINESIISECKKLKK